MECIAEYAVSKARFLRLPNLLLTGMTYTRFTVKAYRKNRFCKWCAKGDCGRWDAFCHRWSAEYRLYNGFRAARVLAFLSIVREFWEPLNMLPAEVLDVIRLYYHGGVNNDDDSDKECEKGNTCLIRPCCNIWCGMDTRGNEETTMKAINEDPDLQLMETKTKLVARLTFESQKKDLSCSSSSSCSSDCSCSL